MLENILKLSQISRCPKCRTTRLEWNNKSLKCKSPSCQAIYTLTEGGIPVFAPSIDPGKYDATYATKYAGIWAFGYKTLHRGENEALYRTVSDLLLSARCATDPLTILDLGCGVGRTTADCSRNFSKSFIIGLDASINMLKRAKDIVIDNKEVFFDLSLVGFKKQTMNGEGAVNTLLAQADAHCIPLMEGCLDVVVSVNLIDRVNNPIKVLREAARVLKKDGLLVFTSPLNWMSKDLWKKHPDYSSLLQCISEIGLHVEEWFDGLFYREIEDARGSHTDWNTLVVKATKPS